MIGVSQYLMNVSDNILKNLFLYYTFLDEIEIDDFIEKQSLNPKKRVATEKLIQTILEQICDSDEMIEKVLNYSKYFTLDFEQIVF